MHGDVFCKHRSHYSNWGKRKYVQIAPDITSALMAKQMEQARSSLPTITQLTVKRCIKRWSGHTWLVFAVNFEGHSPGALVVWKSVMDSLAGWEAPIVVRRKSGEAQYATGVHLSPSSSWHISTVKHLRQFLNAAEVLMLVFIKDAQQDNRVCPISD